MENTLVLSCSFSLLCLLIRTAMSDEYGHYDDASDCSKELTLSPIDKGATQFALYRAELDESPFDRDFKDFTYCLWIYIRDDANLPYNVLEYMSKSAFIITVTVKDSALYTQFGKRDEPKIPSDRIIGQAWTHFCGTYAYSSGVYEVFQNGELVNKQTLGKRVVPGNGRLVIRIKKDHSSIKMNPFRSEEGFKAKATQLHMWDGVLRQSEIEDLYHCINPRMAGNVFNWKDRSHHWKIE